MNYEEALIYSKPSDLVIQIGNYLSINLIIKFMFREASNDNQEAISEQAPDKYMQNGRLVFKTQDAYMNHLKWDSFKSDKPEEIRRFNSQQV